MCLPILLSLCFGLVSGLSHHSQRIIGGSLTTINRYPSIVAVLVYFPIVRDYIPHCGGIIINRKTTLSAAHCFVFTTLNTKEYLIRVGSTSVGYGGTVHDIDSFIIHPNFNFTTLDSDLAIMRTTKCIAFSNVVTPAILPSPTFVLKDNEEVWAAGWGAHYENGPPVMKLRHVQIWTINQTTCARRYAMLTENMLCSGWLGVGGRDQCTGDSGGPLYHNNIVVGIGSFGIGCGDPYYVGVNVRISRFVTWIKENTQNV